MPKKDYCIIVDAYSTGNQLYHHLRQYGYEVIHVQSSRIISPIFAPSFRRGDFEVNIIHEGNITETLEKIKPFKPKCIIPGAETGVELANELARILKLKRNDDEKVHARRNKFLMNELIREKGIPAVEQVKTNSPVVAVNWAERLNRWPVVVKPLHSAASDGVTFCYNNSELESAISKIVNKENSLGILNDEVLVQRFLEGPHYVVNAMTFEGKHYLTDIWRHDFFKGDGTTVIYDKVQLIPYDYSSHNEMVEYVKNVITILGVQHGPTHTEIRLTKDGPRLVEVNCRTMGLSLNEEVISEALSFSHSQLTADSYVNPTKMLKMLEEQEEYKVKKHVYIVFLNSKEDGVIQSIDGVDFVKRLPSFADINLSKRIGDTLQATKNVETHPGFILFTHSSLEQIKKDYLKLRKFEDSIGFFNVKKLVSN